MSFAPYLSESIAEFVSKGALVPRVVRQGGSGLILRSDGEIVLRHQNRQASFGREEAQHYHATINFRTEFYDVVRVSDEVVMANVGDEILLSHPQSDLWLGPQTVGALLAVFSSDQGVIPNGAPNLPDWLTVSKGGGRLLISDGRNGRWVLLGEDHIGELADRLDSLDVPSSTVARPAPPTISLKDMTVHLQSAVKVAAKLEEFASTGEVEAYEEITPIYSLTVSRATEGLELRDSNKSVALSAREARKWASVIRSELDRMKVTQAERGAIRTVFANAECGRWILQWGDEVLVPSSMLSESSSLAATIESTASGPKAKRAEGFLLLLDPETGACVALDDSESLRLCDAGL